MLFDRSTLPCRAIVDEDQLSGTTRRENLFRGSDHCLFLFGLHEDG
jgi:hypothetical protein